MNFLNNIKFLNVDGNRLITCFLQENISMDDLNDISIRKAMAKKFKDKCDSVILLKENTGKYLYSVFEPNAGALGNFSLMCGNGLKAAVSVIPDEKIKIITKAGMFTCRKTSKRSVITVGKFACEEKIEIKLTKQMKKLSPLICLGSNVQNRNFTGEPHLVIFFFENIPIGQLVKIAKKNSLLIKKQLPFKHEVNITYVSFQTLTSSRCFLNACTFERHLGNNPGVALTGSCGTGAMAAANFFNKHILKKRPVEIDFGISFPKAKLEVSIQNGLTILCGKNSYENI